MNIFLFVLLLISTFVFFSVFYFSPYRYILSYTRTLLYHKLCIFGIGCWVNWKLCDAGIRVSFSRLLLHDWVKFTPAEFLPYARYFNNTKHTVVSPSLSQAANVTKKKVLEDWQAAYRHHYQSMDHHHEHHIRDYHAGMSNEQMAQNARPMPAEATVELCVDWISAQLAYDGSWPDSDRWIWLRKINSVDSGMCHFHPATRALLCAIWHALGFRLPMQELTYEPLPIVHVNDYEYNAQRTSRRGKKLRGWSAALAMCELHSSLFTHVQNLQKFSTASSSSRTSAKFVFFWYALAALLLYVLLPCYIVCNLYQMFV